MAESLSQDPLIILISRVSEMQLAQGATLIQQTKDQHEISRLLAVLNTRLEPLVSLSADFSAMRLLVQEHHTCIGTHTRAIDALEIDVEELKTSNAKRSGWEGTLGTLGKIMLGALLALGASLVVSNARAEALKTTNDPVIYNVPCRAVPAPVIHRRRYQA